MGALWQASLGFSASSYCITRSTVGRITKLCPNTNEIYLLSKSANILWKCKTFYSNTTSFSHFHGLRTPREEIAFTERLKIQSQSQIFRYGQSIFCLPHRPNFSDIFDLGVRSPWRWACIKANVSWLVRSTMHRGVFWCLFDLGFMHVIPVLTLVNSTCFSIKSNVTLTDFRLKCVIIITSKSEILWKSCYCGYGKW